MPLGALSSMSKTLSSYNDLAKYYDLLFATWGKDYPAESRQVHTLIQKYKRSSGNLLLDIGCGTAEHLRYLSENYAVTGIDYSPKMLEIAREKLPGIPFYEMDMANFKLSEQYDVIISLFSAIGYVKTVERLNQTIASAKKHLLSGGMLMIEPWFTPEDFEIHRNDVLFGETESTKACRMRESIIKNHIASIKEHILISHAGQVAHFTSEHEFGLFTAQQITHTLNAYQFETVYFEHGLTGRGLYIGIKK